MLKREEKNENKTVIHFNKNKLFKCFAIFNAASFRKKGKNIFARKITVYQSNQLCIHVYGVMCL